MSAQVYQGLSVCVCGFVCLFVFQKMSCYVSLKLTRAFLPSASRMVKLKSVPPYLGDSSEK